MTNTEVDFSCKTPMCHGSWYAAISFPHQLWRISFSDGADLMAKHLGFNRGKNELTNWANANPEIWGNENGEFMFSEINAFNPLPNKKSNLRRIIRHWEQVKENLYGKRKNTKLC
jgi:hypothetical protein